MKLDKILKNAYLILLVLILSACGGVEVENTEWCADQGELGATCFNTLNDEKRRVTPSLWDKERFGYLCTSPSDFAEIKKVIKKLCESTKKCDFEKKKKIDKFFSEVEKTGETKPDENIKGKKVSLWATMYYMKELEKKDSGIPLRNMRDEVIGPKISAKEWCLGAIEGTIKVEGTVYNYAGTRSPRQASCTHSPSERVRWKKSQFDYGIGNRNNALKPFKSIAVDTSFIKSGKKVFIPAAKGVQYEFEGETLTHDGIFYADDVGGAIKGNHIDVYLGSIKGGLKSALKVNPFEFIKSSSNKTFEAYILE